jgi:hypothetical protein
LFDVFQKSVKVSYFVLASQIPHRDYRASYGDPAYMTELLNSIARIGFPPSASTIATPRYVRPLNQHQFLSRKCPEKIAQ